MTPKILPPDLLERFLKSIESVAPISELGLRNHIAALQAELLVADAKEDDATHRAHNAEAKLAEAVAALASARSDTLEEAAREAERTWNSSGQPGFRLIGVGIANNIRAITAITKGEQP